MSFGPPKGKYVKAKRAPVVEAEEEETGFRGYTAEWKRKAKAERRKFMSSVAARRAEKLEPVVRARTIPDRPGDALALDIDASSDPLTPVFSAPAPGDVAIFSRRPSPPRPWTTRRPRSRRFRPVRRARPSRSRATGRVHSGAAPQAHAHDPRRSRPGSATGGRGFSRGGSRSASSEDAPALLRQVERHLERVRLGR